MVCRAGHENDVLEKMRHSCAHVMASAVVSLFPGTKVTIGPCIDDGFYYDFYSDHIFTPEDLLAIEKKMSEIVSQKLPFICHEVSREVAIERFQKLDEKFKVEIIEGINGTEPITLYAHGDFVDLCKGPHLQNTSEIGAFKLLNVAGSYWRGDEKRERLQRIYGTAFATKEDLKAHLTRIEEAQKRDHRRLGRELNLFSFHPEAPASPFFHPRGALVYNLLIEYIRGFYQREAYSEVITPQIIDIDLWKRSGHYDHFRDGMYFTEQEDRQMAVKPMNCPGHCLMFGEKKWSYRELPVRFADFGRLHRFERSGVTHGLTRVRTFCQDDAHIYCAPSQMDGEIEAFLKLVWEVYKDFGFTSVHVALATRPENYLGSLEVWSQAEAVLANSLKKSGVDFSINAGEGAFYGPKIEFQVKDALGRAWQLGTLQVDFSMPERFELAYINNEGKEERPVMLHRAVLGSLERFLGILLEHTGGALPLWLAPVQVLLVPITDQQNDAAQTIAKTLRAQGFRVEVDGRNEKLGLKIREAQLQKIPYMAVMGAREVEAGTMSVRHRKKGDIGAFSLENLLEKLVQERNQKVIDL